MLCACYSDFCCGHLTVTLFSTCSYRQIFQPVGPDFSKYKAEEITKEIRNIFKQETDSRHSTEIWMRVFLSTAEQCPQRIKQQQQLLLLLLARNSDTGSGSYLQSNCSAHGNCYAESAAHDVIIVMVLQFRLRLELSHVPLLINILRCLSCEAICYCFAVNR